MRYKLPGGRLGQLKRRKGRFRSEAKGASKASLMRRKYIKRPKMDKTDLSVDVSQSNVKVCGYGKQSSSSETLSSISCECHQSPDRMRCTASPQLEQQEGKENLRMSWDLIDKRDRDELMDNGSAGDSIFPDDDSNQILPVEQFFGNMDTVPECPQMSATMSLWGHRVHKRRHYYAREDSDDEEPGNTSMQQDDGGSS